MYWKNLFCMAALSGMLFSGMTVHAADSAQVMRDEVVTQVNEQREKNGIPALFESALLNQAAQTRAEELAQGFSHARPDGRNPFTAFTDLGGTASAMGENIAFGYSDEDEVMQGWMSSSGHRENILDSAYQAIGIGVYSAGGEMYWVQMFTDGKNLTSLYTLADVNGDTKINAEDAANVLQDAAELGAGMKGALSRMQRSYADLNGDGLINAQDAALMLQYSAYAGAGGNDSLENFLNAEK